MREHGYEVQENKLRTNPSGHDSIGNNMQCGDIPHGDIHPTGIQNMKDGTMNHCRVPPSDNNNLIHGMSKNVSQVLNHNVSSSYSQSCVSPQGNPRGISHVREHGNKVQESNLRTNPSGHDSIGNNLQCGGIPHSDSHPTAIQSMEHGTMNSFRTGMSLSRPKTTHKILENYNHDYSHSTSSIRRSTLSQNHSSNRNRSKWYSGNPSPKGDKWINNTVADSMWGQTKGNETNATINQSQKEYFEKIQGCDHYKFIPSMSELAALSPIEDNVEGMAKKIERYIMPLKR